LTKASPQADGSFTINDISGKMEKEILAWRKYPAPAGRNYYEEDLADPLVVKELFDYCQILEAAIWEQGWQFLIATYSIGELFEMNRQSGWFTAITPAEYEQELKDHWRELQYMVG
jgi:hypothetical protein